MISFFFGCAIGLVVGWTGCAVWVESSLIDPKIDEALKK